MHHGEGPAALVYHINLLLRIDSIQCLSDSRNSLHILRNNLPVLIFSEITYQ